MYVPQKLYMQFGVVKLKNKVLFLQLLCGSKPLSTISTGKKGNVLFVFTMCMQLRIFKDDF